METKLNASLRFVDTALERPRWRATASYRVLPRLQLGVELNPEAGELVPLATFFLFSENERRPGLFLGTSSDRIGSPEGTQTYFLTLAKAHPRWPISVYGSLAYSEWDRGFNVPFGVAVELPHGFALRPMYDGQRTHLMVSYDRGPVSISLLYSWLERFGVAVSVGL